MPLEFRLHRFNFGPTKDDPATASFPFFFESPIQQVLVAISSFKFQYSTSDGAGIVDHHLGVAQIETAVNETGGNGLELFVTNFLLRDASTTDGQIDDFYEGFVDVQLLVQTA
jgi:hypothetical protein